jgi:lipopolysaccharide export system permease protein
MTYDLHIIRRFFSGYLLLVAGLIVFFVVLHYVEYIDDFMDRGATMSDVFLVYYPNYIPEIVRLTSPLALFISAVFLTGRLTQRLEIASLQTAGVSLYRILLPYLLVGVAVTGFMFWFNGWVVPHTNQVRIAFEQDYTKDAVGQAEYANIHRQNAPGSILSVSFYDRNSQAATVVTLQSFTEDGTMIERIDADRMVWSDSTSSWNLIQPTVRKFDALGGMVQTKLASIDTTLTILPRDLARTQGDVDAMSISDARDYLDALKRSGANRLGRPLVLYYGKFSYPFANLILILLAVPMASVRRRGGQTVQLGLGLTIAFIYLALMKLIEPFGYAGTLSPVLAAWLPHVIFLVFACVVLLRVRK